MEDIHSTFLTTLILEMNSVTFGNKNGIRREIISKTNAVASNSCFKSFPKLESYLYIANRLLFFKIPFLISLLKKVLKNALGPKMATRKTNDAVILKLHGEGKSLRQIAAVFGCSKTAVRKQLLRLQAKGGNPNPQNTGKIEDKPREETLTHKVASRGYLRKLGTRQVFAYTDQLMQRGDMVFYTGHLPVPEDFRIPESELEWLSLVKGKVSVNLGG